MYPKIQNCTAQHQFHTHVYIYCVCVCVCETDKKYYVYGNHSCYSLAEFIHANAGRQVETEEEVDEAAEETSQSYIRRGGFITTHTRALRNMCLSPPHSAHSLSSVFRKCAVAPSSFLSASSRSCCWSFVGYVLLPTDVIRETNQIEIYAAQQFILYEFDTLPK